MHYRIRCQISAKSGQEVCHNREHKKKIKLHKFKFRKIAPFKNALPNPRYLVEYEKNRPDRYSATLTKVISTYDGQTDGRHDRRTDGQTLREMIVA